VWNLSLLDRLISVGQTTEYHRFDQTTSGNNRPSRALQPQKQTGRNKLGRDIQLLALSGRSVPIADIN
jgi:hypothetical protein